MKKVKEVTVLPGRGFIQAMLRGIFPQKYKEVFGRFYISGRVKTLPVVMRDQGREGSFRGQGEPVQPPAI